MDKFQQARLEFQQRIDDGRFEHDQALDRRDEVIRVVPPPPEEVAEDDESMRRTVRGIRERGAESDEDRKLREDAEAFMAPEVDDPIPPPPVKRELDLLLLEARIQALEDADAGRVILQSLDTTGASVAERGYDIGKGIVGASTGAEETTATTGHAGTFDLNAVNVEINTDVSDVDLANDKIIIKQYCSGVYKVSITCEGEITSASSGASAGQTKAGVKQDGVLAFEWSFLIGTNAASSTGTDYENSSTSSKMIYIDASAADVALTVDYDMYTTGGVGGSVTLRLMQFSAKLVTLAQEYNEI